MKSLLILWKSLADELAERCCTVASRDFETVTRRVEAEGISFLTITLPTYAKGLESALERGYVSSDLFPAFGSGARGLPRFLQGFLRNVFDESGQIYPTTPLVTDCILAIRQLCYLFNKIQLPCSSEREAGAITAFVVADQEAKQWDECADPKLLNELERMSRLLFGSVINPFAEKIRDEDLDVRHGSGAVADRLRGNAKWTFRTWPSRLEDVFPYHQWGQVNHSWGHTQESVQFLSEDEEIPSRVILVPKTLKTPRVIAAEPSALQYIQQGLMHALVPLLENDPLIGGMVGFTDQTGNQRLAQSGSRTGELATLDLSEASDRVTLKQAVATLGWNPWVKDAILASRSQQASLPDGTTLNLGKFAAMGSAMCFPTEAMVFLTAVFVGIEDYTRDTFGRDRITRRDVVKYRGKVRVYGDDIIVPVDTVEHVMAAFARYGWKVNANKSFWNGKFRESCGGDYYDGEWVTPIRLRRLPPTTCAAAEDVVSHVSFRNQLYKAGFWRTASEIDAYLKKVLRHYPVVTESSSLLGRVSFLPPQGDRWDKDRHVPKSFGYIVDPKIPASLAEDHAALLKCLLTSNEDEKHLSHAGRPVAVDIKLRWRSVI